MLFYTKVNIIIHYKMRELFNKYYSNNNLCKMLYYPLFFQAYYMLEAKDTFVGGVGGDGKVDEKLYIKHYEPLFVYINNIS